MTHLPPIRYSIAPLSPEAHLFEVRCTVVDPDREGQRFALPAWIPGSYLVRDFARHVVAIGASNGRRTVTLEKIDKHSWRAAPVRGPLTVRADVYACDLSVRGAHLDTTHGFFNGSCVFLRPLGCEDRRCEIEILPPKGARYRNWGVATSMRRSGARPRGFGGYAAADYDELIDHPVEMGEFRVAKFRAGGVPHEAVVTGSHSHDTGRLARDLERLCEHQIRFFGRPAPMDRYVFLVTAVGEGYGGLEHRASAALLCARDDLPRPGMKAATESYRGFLGLASHEYFHAWNVKRIKPAAFVPYDLARENYTRLLWLFEGFTSYYDDLALVRSGLVTRDQYLEILGRSITSHLRTPGRRRQTLAESSFDAWTKYYRPDENTPNAVVSYYVKGSLVALCLDLLIRDRTRGRSSLDDVMRSLWRRHGVTGIGVAEGEFERLAQEVTGLGPALRRFFDTALRSTRELPLKALLATHGIAMALRPAESSSDKGGRKASGEAAALARKPALGVRTRAEGRDLVVTHVLEGGAAQAAGLAAGDVIAAIDGIRASSLDPVLDKRKAGEEIVLHVFRRGELLQLRARLRASPRDTCVLSLDSATAAAPLRRWLGS